MRPLIAALVAALAFAAPARAVWFTGDGWEPQHTLAAPAPLPSWHADMPVVFTAWEPDLARTGPWLIARQIRNGGDLYVWEVPGVGYIAQAESPAQAQAAADFLRGVQGQKAVVAIASGWQGDDLKRFLAEGVDTVFVESYGPEGWPYYDLNRTLWQARHDGWPNAIPVVGVYHGYALANYQLAPYAPNFGVYLAEEMQPADWQQLAYLTGTD